MNFTEAMQWILPLLITLVFCCVGLFLINVDLFSMFHHPLAKKAPHLHKIFGAACIVCSLLWFAGWLWMQ